MNVLMFGWEFPPNISGGLGTACSGILSGLATYCDVKVIFVVPKTDGNEFSENVQFISAGNILVDSAISSTLPGNTCITSITSNLWIKIIRNTINQMIKTSKKRGTMPLLIL